MRSVTSATSSSYAALSERSSAAPATTTNASVNGKSFEKSSSGTYRYCVMEPLPSDVVPRLDEVA